MRDFLTLAMSTDFVGRGQCGNWHTSFVWLYVISNLMIFAAYVAIPFVLGMAMFRGRHPGPPTYISHHQLFWMRVTFAAFILFCGIGHLEGVISFFRPTYHLYAIWHSLTAIASWGAVIVVAKMRYRILPGV